MNLSFQRCDCFQNDVNLSVMQKFSFAWDFISFMMIISGSGSYTHNSSPGQLALLLRKWCFLFAALQENFCNVKYKTSMLGWNIIVLKSADYSVGKQPIPDWK